VPDAGRRSLFGPFTLEVSHKLSDDIVRVGPNYRFDWGGRVIAKY